MEIIYSLEDIEQLAKTVLQKSSSKNLLFYGPMGAGKTTFIKALCVALGVEDGISSPTFSLVNEYRRSNDKVVYHFDFYRINDEEEALDMGFYEYIDSEAYCLIEWPEKIENLLPLDQQVVRIEILDDQKRKLILP
jgi:tRNA threonylcarbamoyladenosine biosynthesis protein TsaE